MSEKIFGITLEEIKRQSSSTHAVDPQSNMEPINPNDGFLEPCIRGGKKILDDPDKKDMFNRIYTGKKQNFIERLTDEQLVSFLDEILPKTEKYVYSYVKSPENIYVVVNKNMGDCMYNFTLEEFDSIGYRLPDQWLKYLYKVFGEEYKQAYLAECAKIFE